MPRGSTSGVPSYHYTCPQCSVAFTGRTKGRRYCSYACANAARGRTINAPRPCLVCGTPITTNLDSHPSLYARLKTCSRSCGQVLAHQASSSRRLPLLPERPCRRCGRAFVPPNRGNKGLYCSNSCHLADLHEAGRQRAATSRRV